MTKRIFTVLCMLTVLICLFSVAAAPVQAASADFQVGYARVDINPYNVDGVFESGIMELPLRGSGDVWNRLSTKGLIDDNGDGMINEEDGLKVTCIAVSDENGNTVLLITIDLIGGALISRVRQEICTRVDAALASGELTGVKLSEDQIYYAGTHTHNAPDTTVYASGGKTGVNNEGKELSVINKNLGIWIDRTIEDIGDAAILALKDRAAAKLTKDSLSASKDTRAPVCGKVMNSVRHYNNTADNCVAGDNFNNRGSNPKQVTQVNDTMYLVQFDFSEHNEKTGDDKLPIILANWRGHPSLNNSDSYPGGGRNCMSSDYVSAFRHALEFDCDVDNTCAGVYASKQKYRVAFFNGEGGNVNPRGYEKVNGTSAYAWIDNAGRANGDCRGNVYGRVLCAMAKHALESSSNREIVAPGEIRTMQYVYNSTRRTTGISALGYEAGKAYQAKANVTNPFRYTSASGEIYVVGSKFHASNLVSNWDATLQEPKQDIVDMELNAFMIGKDLAFVTAPGEPFDYYYNADGSNAWHNLVSGTYGTPFVLGYCNGAKGYIPNSKAYDYNLGSTKWMRGSYESSITPYEKGAGEHMIDLFENMLNMLEAGESDEYLATCEHCKTTVTWEPYNGQAQLFTGHYYLREDVKSKQIHIMQGEQVCFDLKGHTLRGDNRAFYTYSKGGSTLNLMDTSANQSGTIMGSGGNTGIISGYSGATVIVDTGNTMNFYGGTMTVYHTSVRSIANGGILLNKGTFNMYGGVITGGVGYHFTGKYLKSKVPTEFSREGVGAAVYNSGTFNMSGGRIDEGVFKLITGIVSGDASKGYTYSQTYTPCEGNGVCMYSTGKVNLSGDAVIADLFYNGSSAELFHIETAETPFTGSVGLTYGKPLSQIPTIGTCTPGFQIPDGAITFTDGALEAKVQGGQIMASAGAAIIDVNGEFTYYTSFDAAYAAYTYSKSAPNYIKLMSDVTKNYTFSKTVYLDLSGYSITGDITVSSGTLYCMDSRTDDYDVSDGVYGKLSGKITGKALAVPAKSVGAAEEDYRFGYIAVTEPSGMSFHRIKAQVASMSLRPDVVGVYYTGLFAGDALACSRVLEYGIVLNADEVPNENNFGDINNKRVYATAQWNGSCNVVGALLKGIMKPGNSPAVNAQNADKVVYGRAYIKTEDGYIFSELVKISLKDLVEYADELGVIQGSGLTKMAAMYAQYESVMKQWNLPRLRIDMENLD